MADLSWEMLQGARGQLSQDQAALYSEGAHRQMEARAQYQRLEQAYQQDAAQRGVRRAGYVTIIPADFPAHWLHLPAAEVWRHEDGAVLPDAILRNWTGTNRDMRCQPSTSSSKTATLEQPSGRVRPSDAARVQAFSATHSSVRPAATSGQSAPSTAALPSCPGLTVVAMEDRTGTSYRARSILLGTLTS